MTVMKFVALACVFVTATACGEDEINRPPFVRDVDVTTVEDTAISVDVRATGRGDLTFTLGGAPMHGTVTNVGPTYTYTPTANYAGPDVIIVEVSNGSTAVQAAIRITVTPVNDAPTAVDDSAATAFGMPVTIPAATLLANDSDPEGTALQIATIGLPEGGTVGLVGNQLTFTPTRGFSGTATFTYTASDGELGGTATVSVAVSANTAPVAVNDTLTVAEDGSRTVNVLTNDTDIDGDTLSVASNTPPVHGTVTFAAGIATYTPEADFNGVDLFTYTISDGFGGTATATVTATVTPVNDVPVAIADTLATTEDVAATVAVLTNDTDIDGDTLTASAATAPLHGTVAYAAGIATYTPAANYNGPDAFTYRLSDGRGGVATGSVTVAVASVNDVPVARVDTITTAEDTARTSNVLANDSDPDGGTLAVTGNTAPAHGVVSFAGGVATYVPAANYNGPDTFTYTLSDGQGASVTGTVNVTVTSVNDAPVAVADSITTAEDTAVTHDVVTNDTDLDGGTLVASANTAPLHGTATYAANVVTYRPTANYNGPDSFVYRLSDGQGGTALGTVSVTVTSVNDVPVAVVDTISTAEDTAATRNVLTNDTDSDGGTLAVTANTAPAHGVVTFASGVATYTPTTNYFGPDAFTYTLSDGQGGSATGTVNITVTAVNDRPIAGADTIATVEDTAGTANLLANDSDPDGDTVTITATTTPTKGTVSVAGGVATYTPGANRNGSDTFTYTLSDGRGGTATGTVTITITSVNDAPVAGNDTITTTEDTARTANLLANDSDVDGGTLAITSNTAPAHGTVSIAGGVATYTPAPNYFGPDAFSYTLSDGQGATTTGTVSVTVTSVNDLPIAGADTMTTFEDTSASRNVVTNDTDSDGGTLSASANTAPLHGTVTYAANVATYTPVANYNGPDTFRYTLSDGQGGSVIGTVSVTVTPLNDPPVAGTDTISTAEDTARSANLLTNDSDIDGDTLTITGNTTPAHGTVSIASGVATYTPVANYNGPDTFSYTVSDGQGGTATAAVTITVTSVNDLPVAGTDTITTTEDTARTANLLTNDADSDGGTLAITGNTAPAHGTVSIAAGVATYTPAANYNGPDTFRYTLTDGQGGSTLGTVNITVTSVNDGPIAAADTITTNEDAAVTQSLVANDSDPDGGTLAITGNTAPAHGSVSIASGVATYTPTANYFGPDSFTYTLSDGQGGTATGSVTITVAAVNDEPIAVADTITTAEDTAGTRNVVTNDSDPDGNPLTASANTPPANGTVTYSANVATYTPTANYNGSDTFRYTLSDGQGGTAIGTVTVTVTSVNDRPVAVTDTITTNEDTAASRNLLANDSDVDGGTLAITGSTPPTNGTATFSGGVVTYTPAANYFGPDTFTYTLSDGQGGTATGTVNITVTSINDRPVAVADSITTNEDTAATRNVVTNDSDPDGGTLTASAATAPLHGTATYAANVVTYTPVANYNGPDTFTYTLSDGQGGTAVGTVNVTVTSVNDNPIAVNDSLTTNEDTSVSRNLATNDSDPDGGTLAVSPGTNPANGTVFYDGGVTYVPNPNFNGTDSFTYTLSDGQGGTATGTVAVTVNAVNDAPRAVADSIATDEDTGATLDVSANDTDVDGDTLTVTGVTPPSNGTVSLAGNVVTYTPTANFYGADAFTYSLSDGQGGTAIGNVAVTVASVNDLPVAVGASYTIRYDFRADFSQAIDITLVATDADGDALIYSIASPPTEGTLSAITNDQVTYTPNPEGQSDDPFTFQVFDGTADSLPATITIVVSYCDNGAKEGDEECDDGNFTNGDGCETDTCVFTCGSGTGADRVTVEPFSGSCFAAYDATTLSYSDAQAFCIGVGGNLPTIQSPAESSAASDARATSTTIVWLGADDIVSEGVFQWVTGESFQYNEFTLGEPDGGTVDNCLAYDSDTTWGDRSCALSPAVATVCEFAIASVPLECCSGAPNSDACTCIVGDIQPCYDGDPTTQNVGSCRGGFQTCEDAESGSRWGACQGQRLPEAERCSAGDFDCDGIAQNVPGGCGCTIGTSQSCYSGTPGTETTGSCRAGSQFCETGTWMPCSGQAAPVPDECKVPSCTGEPNPGCQCVDGDSQACEGGIYSGENYCYGGIQNCTGGQWGACFELTLPP